MEQILYFDEEHLFKFQAPTQSSKRSNQTRLRRGFLNGGSCGTAYWGRGFGATKASWRVVGSGRRVFGEAGCRHEEKREAKLVALPPAHDSYRARGRGAKASAARCWRFDVWRLVGREDE
jgi:hypothetical protein